MGGTSMHTVTLCFSTSEQNSRSSNLGITTTRVPR